MSQTEIWRGSWVGLLKISWVANGIVHLLSDSYIIFLASSLLVLALVNSLLMRIEVRTTFPHFKPYRGLDFPP